MLNNPLAFFRLSFVTLVLAAISFSAMADTITWTNTAGGNWSDPSNWSPNQVPGHSNALDSGDDVMITNPGNYTVVLDVGTSPGYWDVRNLTVGADSGTQVLAITNRILYASILVTGGGALDVGSGGSFHASILVQNGGQLNTQNGVYYVDPFTIGSGGTLNANGDTFHQTLTIDSGAVFNTPGATIDADAWLAVNGALNMSSGVLYVYGPLTNSGAITLNSNSGLYVYDNQSTYRGGIVNLAGGVLNLDGFNGVQSGGYGHEYFINHGAVISRASCQISSPGLDSSGGVVTNLSGTLRLSTLTNTLAGTYYAASGAVIQFTGGTASNPLFPGTPLVLDGPGQFQFVSGGLELTNDIIPGLILQGGVLWLGDDFQDGAVTNLALDGTVLTNTLPVAGTFNVANSHIYGDWTAENGATVNADGAEFDGAVTVAGGAILNTPGANIGSAGSLTMNGVLNITSGVLYLNGPMTNSGSITLSSNGGIYIYDNQTTYFGALINLPAGVINLNGFNGIRNGGYGREYFLNQGAVISRASAGIDVTSLNLSGGVITNLSGTLGIHGFTNTITGMFHAAAGTTIQIGGGTGTNPLRPGVPLVLAGDGQYQFVSGLLELPDNTVPGLMLTGGSLQLGPSFQGGAITNLALNGIVLTNSNPLPITGNFSTTNSELHGDYPLAGGASWAFSGGNVHASIEISPAATLNIFGTMQIMNDGWINNANAGQINLVAGYLYAYGPVTNSGVITLNGNNYIYIYNNGTSYLGGVLNQPDGLIHLLSSGGIGTISYGDEYLINQGKIIKSASRGNAAINVSKFSNSGSILSEEGTLQLNPITLDAGGTIGVRINSATDYGKLAISGAAALAGAFDLELNGTYEPPNGTTFNVLSYGSYSGAFDSFDLPAVLTWLPSYQPNGFSITVSERQFALSVSGGQLSFAANGGTPGNQGIVFSSVDLKTPLSNWTPVSTNTFDENGHFDFTRAFDPNKPREFYILKFP
ncbi:MAG TPA: hypothetical protein VHH88_09860 [Verrucomicrobiae bacterium]|nr:hypothetical protein [Verrucomicrobiae bacterium]